MSVIWLQMMSNVEEMSYQSQDGNLTGLADASGVTTPDDPNASYTTVYDPGVIVFLDVSQVLFPTAYFLLVFVGLVGNSTVLFIIVRHPDMQTVTNYFIANLAITDIATLMICTLPAALSGAGVLPMGPGVCKAVNYMQFVSNIEVFLINNFFVKIKKH